MERFALTAKYLGPGNDWAEFLANVLGQMFPSVFFRPWSFVWKEVGLAAKAQLPDQGLPNRSHGSVDDGLAEAQFPPRGLARKLAFELNECSNVELQEAMHAKSEQKSKQPTQAKDRLS